MNKGGFVQNKLMPVAVKVGNNKCLIAIRDGITLAMPLIIIGSLFIVLASLPIPGWEEFMGNIGVAGYLWKGVSSSFGLIALIAAFGVPYSLAKQYKADGVSAGIVALSAFITVTAFVANKEAGIPESIPTAFLASRGLFVAIILGLINGYIYQWFINHNIRIKLPESVPPAVAKSFSALIPGTVIISFWLIVFGLLDKFGLSIHELVALVLSKPLGLIGNNVIGVSLVVMLNSLFWFVGIHGGNVVNSLLQPLWLQNLDINRAAHQAGQPLTEVFTAPFMDNFVYMGGGGATLGLVIALAYLAYRKHSSKQSKIMSPLTLVPGMFNINEPAMFGMPIVLNFILVIPFIFAPVVNLLVSYAAMASGLVSMTYAAPSWTMPPVISGILATGDIKASILQIVCLALDILLYLPFVLALEKTWKHEEGLN